MHDRPLVDRDPGDETTVEPHEYVTGLCASDWCQDAALPAGEYCRDCEEDIRMLREQLEGLGHA